MSLKCKCMCCKHWKGYLLGCGKGHIVFSAKTFRKCKDFAFKTNCKNCNLKFKCITGEENYENILGL